MTSPISPNKPYANNSDIPAAVYTKRIEYLTHPERYAELEMIRRYGEALSEESRLVYEDAIERANRKMPLDEWAKYICTIL